MTKRIIFHCGSAKAGSTSIQAHLWANRSALKQQGIHFCPRFVRAGNVDALNKAIKNLRSPSGAQAAIRAGRKRLEALFDQEGYNTVIISNESALGDPFHDGKPGYFPFLAPTLAGLKQMFEGYDVTSLFFVRDQAALIPSFYGQRVRQGAHYSFAEFIQKTRNTDMSWQPVIAAIAEAFGSEASEFHTFEKFIQNPANHTAQLFAKLLGVDVMTIKTPVIKNQKASARAVAVQRFINRHIDSINLKNEAARAVLKKHVRRGIFSPLEFMLFGERLTLPSAVKDEFQRQYENDLRALGLG